MQTKNSTSQFIKPDTLFSAYHCSHAKEKKKKKTPK